MLFAIVAAVLVATGCGSNHKPSRIGGSIGSVAWAPNGETIAWGERARGGERIWTSAPDLAHAHLITGPIDALGQIVWLGPRRLLYWADFRLFLVSPGRRPAFLAGVAGSDFSIDRSDSRVALGGPSCSTGCTSGVWVASLPSGRLHRLTRTGCCPAWSPDGREIAYLRTTVAPRRRHR
jgi:hypothetical protein